MELTGQHKQFDGYTRYYTHQSEACRAPMKFSAYLPPEAVQAEKSGKKFPVLYWLSGLACNEEIFMTEAQAQAVAKKYGVILVAPDTSPRDLGIEGEDDTYDLGSAASFYVNATQKKWSAHYQMDTYVTQELRHLAEKTLPIDPSRRGIFGHSMGGHGALVLGLRNPDLYRSISAFAPICAPSKAPWGLKAFAEYLGTDRATWSKYDANELLKTTTARTPMLIDQGTDDEFFEEQLFTDEFEKTVKSVGYPAQIRRQAGYDHSYYFISTFMDDHVAFHAKFLKG
jgi:S-formylglutathione hydrolase